MLNKNSIYEIQWTVYINSKTIERTMLLMGQVEELLDNPLNLQSCRPYWRDPNQFEVQFSTPYFECSKEEAVYRTLMISNVLSWEWAVRPPAESETGELDFGATTTHSKLTGIEWMAFELCTVESVSKVWNQPSNF